MRFRAAGGLKVWVMLTPFTELRTAWEVTILFLVLDGFVSIHCHVRGLRLGKSGYGQVSKKFEFGGFYVRHLGYRP